MTESHQMKINFTKKEVNKAYNNTKWLKVKVHNEYVTLPAVSPLYTGPNPLIHVYTPLPVDRLVCVGGCFGPTPKCDMIFYVKDYYPVIRKETLLFNFQPLK